MIAEHVEDARSAAHRPRDDAEGELGMALLVVSDASERITFDIIRGRLRGPTCAQRGLGFADAPVTERLACEIDERRYRKHRHRERSGPERRAVRREPRGE